MNILITGAAGFLGSHLVEHFLKDGHTVVGVDNLCLGSLENLSFCYQNNKRTNQNFTFIKIDCKDFYTMNKNNIFKGIDVVYHCAATAHEGLSVFSPSFITKNIFEASVAVYSAAIASGVKRIINCSSMARYGHGDSIAFGYDHNDGVLFQKREAPFYEHFGTNPVDPYGIAKVASEQVLNVLSETHGIEYVNLVPHNIIGIRQNYTDPHRNVASIMMNRLKQDKEVIIYGDGTQTRCFSPVSDVIGSMVKASDLSNKSLHGQTINIGPDASPISVLNLAEHVYKLAQRDFNPTFMPDRPREVKHAVCSSDKARRLLGYKEVQTLEDCLKEMWEVIPEGGKPFIYDDKPLEIINEKTPQTWSKRLI